MVLRRNMLKIYTPNVRFREVMKEEDSQFRK